MLNLGANQDTSAMLQALKDTGANRTPTNTDETPATLPPLTTFSQQASVEGLTPGQYVTLPISVLVRSSYNARVYYSQEEVDQTAVSMSVDGQQVPALGYVKENVVVIVDGGKRMASCVAGKISTLNVLIINPPATARDEYELSRKINDFRSSQTTFDDAVRWRELLEQGVYENGETLARSLGISPSNVSKTMGLNRIPTGLRRMMADNPQTCALSIAYEISCIFSKAEEESEQERLSEIAEDVVQSIISKELNRQQTVELINARIKGPKTRLRGESTNVVYHGCRGQIKVVPQRGELSFSLKGLSVGDIEDLKTKLQSVLSEQPPVSN
jgi:ParB family chromosome partitioning protein